MTSAPLRSPATAMGLAGLALGASLAWLWLPCGSGRAQPSEPSADVSADGDQAPTTPTRRARRAPRRRAPTPATPADAPREPAPDADADAPRADAGGSTAGDTGAAGGPGTAAPSGTAAPVGTTSRTGPAATPPAGEGRSAASEDPDSSSQGAVGARSAVPRGGESPNGSTPPRAALDGGVAGPAESAPDAGARPTTTGVASEAPLPPAGTVPDAGVPAAASTSDAQATDAGVSDAGVASDAGVPTDGGPAVEGATIDADAGEAGSAAAEPPPAAPAPPPTTTVVQVPMPFVQNTESSDPWAGLREIIPGIPTGGIRPMGLLALLALLAVFSSFIERLRGRLLRDGLLPTLLSVSQICARLLGLLIALALVVQVVPANVRWVVYFILIASGAALGWSMRDVMPDLIAGIVIVFERRIRRGIWIRSDSFAGAVERVGLRSSWLRDSKGHRVAVPNRLLMQAPVVSDEEGERVQEVVVRLGGADAADIRRALRDAVLASPWTTPESEPQVLRDPVDPDLWQVRGKLLSATFASSFQGQLLERAEAHLAMQRRRAREAAYGEDTASGTPTTKHTKLDKSDKPDKNGDKPDKAERPAKT